QLLDIQQELDTTIVFVTHDMNEALRLGHQIILLAAHGHIVQQDSPPELVANPANDFVEHFLGLTRIDENLQTRSTDDGRTLVVADHGHHDVDLDATVSD